MTADPTVGEIGERALVDRIRARLAPHPPWVRLGIGDDAALVEAPRARLEVITTDTLVEGVHFDLAFVSPGDVGAKALAVNLSDLAAMGAKPRVALLSLGLPAGWPGAAFDELVDGLVQAAATHAVALVGGNITRSPALFVDVTAIGEVHPRKALTRAGARPGDALYVTGRPGAATAGLAWLRRMSDAPPPGQDDTGGANPVLAEAAARYRRPEPRIRLGLLVGRNRAASACVDLSDGLADGIRQVAEASGTGAAVDVAAVPWHPALALLWPDPAEALGKGFAGGDDYELLFAVPRRRRRAFEAIAVRPGGLPVTRIGELTDGKEIVVRRDDVDAALPAGYAHFA